MADETPVWSRKRKSLERGDIKGMLPSKKFQSPLVITAPSGKTATKTKSRIALFDGNGSLDEDQIKQQFLARINEAEALLKQKRGASQESILSSLCKTTPRKTNLGTTTPNPFSFMTPGRRRESVSGRRDSVVGRRESVIGRRDSVYGRRSSMSGRREGKTPCKPRFPMSARKMRLRASQQLKMIESQELQASRLAQVKWEVWMEKQERAYGGLLNEILKQPMDPNVKVMEIKHSVGSLGRSSGHGVGIRSASFDSSRSHLRNSGRNLPDDDKNSLLVGHQNRRVLSKAQTSTLRTSREMKDNIGNDLHAPEAYLNQICSVLELKRRLVPYLEDTKCDRIISTMTQIAKYIDDGRLRMKPNCIVLSDVALRTKALGVLFSYNPVWIRLGLAIVLGPIAFSNKNASTLNVTENEGENHPQTTFLEVLIEEHFFGDSPLAKQFATNRSIDGLYRDGYKEALGKFILKRIFLLVLVLDKIKSETALDGQNGIDGLDGGSPLLFQPNGCVKSSRQALEDFLSHVMQGEGDLIVHVGKLGYHVSHIQAPLTEYNFEVRNVVEDLQDGIRLCRLAQLMSHDLSILGKIKFPCQAPKKRTYNCELALQSLAQSGVLLEDETGGSITAEHIASGQREKTLSLIWNLILHLQVPLLVSHPKLFQELERVGLVANPDANGYAMLDLLLSWVQAICANVKGVTIQNFSSSFADGQVLCHLISNFLPQCLPRHAIKIPETSASTVTVEKNNQNEQWELQSSLNNEVSMCKDRAAVVHNFLMVENAAKLLGIAPEVLRLSDMVDEDPCTSERNIIIFVAHLCSALLNADPQSFPASSSVVPRSSIEESNFNLANCSKLLDVDSDASCSSRQDWTSENAATCIQAWYKGRRQRLKFKRIKMEIIVLQRFVRAWLIRERDLKRKTFSRNEEDDDSVVIQGDESEALQQEDFLKHVLALQLRVRNRKLRVAFLSQRQGARTIQNYWQKYQIRRKERRVAAAVVIQSYWRGHLARNLLSQRFMAARTIQSHFRGYIQRAQIQKCIAAAVVIQSYWRGHLARNLLSQRYMAAQTIQRHFRGYIQRAQLQKCIVAAVVIQSYWRGHLVRNLHSQRYMAARTIQSHFRGYIQRAQIQKCIAAAVVIQSYWRGHLARNLLSQRYMAAQTILRHFRGYIQRAEIQKRIAAALLIQKYARGCIQKSAYRSRLVGVERLQALFRGALVRLHAKRDSKNITKIQALWRGCCTRRLVNRWRAAASVIQSHFRGYKQRRYYKTLQIRIAHLQAAFRGALVRKRLKLTRQAVEHIQSAWHRYKMKRFLKEKDAAAIIIQSRYRCVRQRTWYQSQKSRVILLEATVRGHLAWKKFRDMRLAVIKLQSRWRGCLARKTMEVERLAAIHIQRRFRSHLLSRRNQLQELQYATITIQSSYRSYVQRKLYYRDRLAIIRIQSMWRGYAQRKKFESIMKDAVPKQATITAACVIQSHWRGFLARKKHLIDAPHYCAEQSGVGCASMQQEISRWGYNFDECKAAQILTLWAKAQILRRRFLALRRAVTTIQRVFRGHKARQGFQLTIRSVCRIQAHWRGYKWRSGQSRMKQHMQELRLRMQSTAATVDNSQRLGNRLTEALAQLLSMKTVSGILNTCATIDMATEHSKQCCERLAEGGAVNKLLMLIQTVNRSPPHEQVLKHALSILASLARFPNLAFSIAGEAESINIIVEQLLIFRNKEEVFSKAMKILLHVCRTPGCVDIIQQDAVVIRRLHNVSALLERRFEVEKRNLEKLPPSTPSLIRQAADRKMRETVQQKQSIMSIMPGLVALQKLPPPRKDTVNVNKLPLAKSIEERKRVSPAPSISSHIKTSNGITKVSTATSATLRSKIISNNKSTSQRPISGAPWQGNLSVPLSGDRKYEGAVKASVSRPSSFSSGRGDKPSISIRTKPGCELQTSQTGLPRVPLKDRSNHATKAVRK